MADKRYHTILFDWDGTLAQTIPVWEGAFKAVFSQLHMPIDINQTTEQLWLDSAILQELGIEHAGFFDLVYEQIGNQFPQTPLYPEATTTLKALQTQGIALALVTSTRRKYVLQALEHHQLTDLFTTVIASEDVVKHKPDAEPYQRALDGVRGDRESTLIVGDSRFDLLGSHNIGIDCALFLPSENEKYYKREDLVQLSPKYIVNNYQELLALIVS